MVSSRTINNALIRSLGRCVNPVYVLDADRVVRYVNAALLAWLAVDGEEIVGVRCDYHSQHGHSQSEQIAARLCPPPDVFSGKQCCGSVARAKEGSSLESRTARFSPLLSDDGSLAAVLAIVDATEPVGVSSNSPTAPEDLHRRLQALRSKIGSRYRTDRLLGDSNRLQRVREQVDAAIASQTRVVVVGPRGSGCEHVARTIYFGSHGQDDNSALIPVDCRLTDAEMLQATITSLRTQVESGNDVRLGTLLLLEADELSGDAQQELLGFMRLPSVEFTIISTARRSLLDLIAEGEYLPDLAHALSTLEIELPALAERCEDVPLLCQAALETFNAQGDQQLSGFTEEALEQLAACQWPGNVEQLFQAVSEACSIARGPLVTANDLPRAVQVLVRAGEVQAKQDDAVVLDDLLSDIEAELFRRALTRAKGNKTRAAELLGISRARFHRRLEQLVQSDEETRR